MADFVAEWATVAEKTLSLVYHIDAAHWALASHSKRWLSAQFAGWSDNALTTGYVYLGPGIGWSDAPEAMPFFPTAL